MALFAGGTAYAAHSRGDGSFRGQGARESGRSPLALRRSDRAWADGSQEGPRSASEGSVCARAAHAPLARRRTVAGAPCPLGEALCVRTWTAVVRAVLQEARRLRARKVCPPNGSGQSPLRATTGRA